MLAETMAKPRKTTKTPTKGQTRTAAESRRPDKRPRAKSLLSRTGDEAKAAAERALLLKTLKSKRWNLTHTAEALEMPGPSQVLRAIDALGLRDEYEAARGS